MSWTVPAVGLPASGSGSVGVVTTSTSTLVVPDAGFYRLRMFGVDAQQLAAAIGEPYANLLQNAVPSVMPVGNTDGDTLPMAWLESGPVVAGGPAEDFAFPTFVATQRYLTSTVIPTRKADMVLHGAKMLRPLYKDVHVLRLSNRQGYLMLGVRYCSPRKIFGPPVAGVPESTGNTPDPQNSYSAIVGWWSPDASFASPEVVGPVFLVSRVHGVYGPGATLWVSVPAAVEVNEGGTPMLYVYYTAEATWQDTLGTEPKSPAGFVAGTHLRTLRLKDVLVSFGRHLNDRDWLAEPEVHESLEGLRRFPDGITEVQVTVPCVAAGATDPRYALSPEVAAFTRGHAGSRVEPSPPATTDETLWADDGAYLVPGTSRGKVRICVATGREFDSDAGDLTAAPQGNTLLWNHYAGCKDVDAVPVWAGKQLCLYAAVNYRVGTEAPGPNEATCGYGIWRAAAIPDSVTNDFGIDFVVFPFDRATWTGPAPGERDMAAVSIWITGTDEIEAHFQYRLDPDPVQLPSAGDDWLVYTGHELRLDSVVGDDATAGAPWTAAWH